MPNVGDVVTLVGITRHGKNRIREHGDRWQVLKITSTPPLFSKSDAGPWMVLESVSRPFFLRSGERIPDIRFVRVENDEHFRVKEERK